MRGLFHIDNLFWITMQGIVLTIILFTQTGLHIGSDHPLYSGFHLVLLVPVDQVAQDYQAVPGLLVGSAEHLGLVSHICLHSLAHNHHRAALCFLDKLGCKIQPFLLDI